MKITFFNHYHNGDVHLSRGIIRKIINKVHQLDPSVKFSYSHPNPSNLLFDIAKLDYDTLSLNKLNPKNSIIKTNDTIYINTWYDQQDQKYAKKYGILTIDALYGALDDSCNQIWGFKLSEISNDLKDFFPVIDYSIFDIEEIQFWLHNHQNKKILIENGHSQSGQSVNFDMTSVAIKLAKQHPNIIFILSQKTNIPLPDNIIFSSDLIKKKDGSDLNEISFLSTHCNMIIGRCSGVFSFSMVKENLFERQIKMLGFSHLMSKQSKFWIGSLFKDQINYSSNITISSEININNVFDIANNSIKDII
jgi:hypothetical protein